ncbi:MAG: hypothetical protein LE168_05180 [Endomicrobium sp.]|nr:hypothetical protein [Endomicrobium sp.]
MMSMLNLNQKEIKNISMLFIKTPAAFNNILDDIGDYTNINFQNTFALSRYKAIKMGMLIQELLDIQEEARQYVEYELADNVINNATEILKRIVEENIEIPHFSSNPMKQIGFTWHTEKYIVFLTIDASGTLNFTRMELEAPNKGLSFQGDMNDINYILSGVKDAM